MKISSIQKLDIKPMKTVAKVAVGTGIAAAAVLAAGYKTDVFLKAADKLGKSEVLSNGLRKFNKAGNVIYDKAAGVISFVKTKASSIVSNDKLKGFAAGVKEAGVNVLKKGKKVASYVTGKVKSAASSLADTIKSKINPQKIQ